MTFCAQSRVISLPGIILGIFGFLKRLFRKKKKTPRAIAAGQMQPKPPPVNPLERKLPAGK